MEWKLQAECYNWFAQEYPAHKKLLCYNNNNSPNGTDGAKNKAMGLQKGRADLVLYYNKQAVMIEVKTEKGEQSPYQKTWQVSVAMQGFDYYIVKNLEQFKLIITTYMDYSIKKPLDRIKELAAVIDSTNDETVLKNSVGLLRIEISRWDKERFNGEELPF